MYVFIDASGDPGFKVGRGSSRYFVLALVTVEDRDISECDRRIDQIRQEQRLDPEYEFHFSTNSKKIRQAFLSAISSSPFSCQVFAVDKSDLASLRRLGIIDGNSLFRFLINAACNITRSFFHDATVIIDGQRVDREFRNQLRTYMSRQLRGGTARRPIREFRVRNSKTDNLLQLADYVAGVSNRVLSGRPDGIDLHGHLEHHESTVEIWPRWTRLAPNP